MKVNYEEPKPNPVLLLGKDLEPGKVYKCVSAGNGGAIKKGDCIVRVKFPTYSDCKFVLFNLRTNMIHSDGSDSFYYEECPKGTQITLEVE